MSVVWGIGGRGGEIFMMLECVCVCGFWFTEAPFFFFSREQCSLCFAMLLRFRRRIVGLKEEKLGDCNAFMQKR